MNNEQRRTEDKGQTTKDKGQTTKDKGQTTKDEGQTTTNKGQMMDEGRRETPAGGYLPGMHPTTPRYPTTLPLTSL
jgi:hypothetical protein